MLRTTVLYVLGCSLCGVMVGCESEAPLPDYPLDGITVYVSFDDPICGGTFDWIERRLRWLETETGLPASTSPISYYWLREDVFDLCPTGACGSATDNTIYTPLELFSHELVHGHLAQLGLPRPWLAEGMAQLFEDSRWQLPNRPVAPSDMLATTKPLELSYPSAASFVRYLRDRFGMAAVIELYAALDRVDVQATPEVFLTVLGESWGAVEDAYLATYTPVPVGSINCDFPEFAPEGDTWTFPVASLCEDATSIGPFLGWMDTDTPRTDRYVTLDIPEAGVYSVTMTSSATISIELVACDEPLRFYSRYGTKVDEEIEFVPGRKRLWIATDIADEAVGEVIVRGPLPAPLGVAPARSRLWYTGQADAVWHPRRGETRGVGHREVVVSEGHARYRLGHVCSRPRLRDPPGPAAVSAARVWRRRARGQRVGDHRGQHDWCLRHLRHLDRHRHADWHRRGIDLDQRHR